MSEHKWSNGDACEVRTLKDHTESRPDVWLPATYIGRTKDNAHAVEYDDDLWYATTDDIRPPAPPEPVKVEKWFRVIGGKTPVVAFVETQIERADAAHVALLHHPPTPEHPDGRTELDTTAYRRAGAEQLAAKLKERFGEREERLSSDQYVRDMIGEALCDIGASPIAEPDADGLELLRLREFKRMVHNILDEFGVPAFDGDKCRASLRLRWLATAHKRAIAGVEAAERRGAIAALEKLRREWNVPGTALAGNPIDAALAELRKEGE